MILANEASLKAFIERYDRDRQACAARYSEDREAARIWRSAMDRKIDDLTLFIAEMKPNYRRLLAFVGMTVIGAMGLIFKLIWEGATRK